MRRKIAVFMLACTLTISGCNVFHEDTGAYDAGLAALEQKDYVTALQQFQNAVKNDDRETESYRQEGIVYYKMQDYEHAIALFQKSLDSMKFKKPEFSRDISYYLGDIYQKQGEYEKAYGVYDQLLSEEEDAKTYFLRGKLYLEQGDDAQAEADFRKSLEKDENFDNYIQIYLAYAKQNRSADGSVYLEEVVKKTPENPEAEHNQGRAYYYLEEYDHAKTVLIQAQNDGSEQSMILLGKIYLETGDTANARAIYRNLQQLDDMQAAAFNGLALCDMEEGNYDEALSYISQGLACGESDEMENLLYNEIIVYENRQDFATAKAKMNEFLSKYPDNTEALRENTFLQSRE